MAGRPLKQAQPARLLAHEQDYWLGGFRYASSCSQLLHALLDFINELPRALAQPLYLFGSS
jgi:hypothetical protein